jgi:hypothetical protein
MVLLLSAGVAAAGEAPVALQENGSARLRTSVERAFTSTGSGTVRAAYLEGYIWLESHTNGGTYAYTQGDSIHVEVYAEDLDDYGYYLPVIGVWDRYTDEFVDLYTPENYVYYFDTVYADIDTSGLEVSSGRYEVVAFLWDDVY